MTRRVLIAGALALTLSACQGLTQAMEGTVRDGNTQDEIEAATNFVLKDLREAKASADAHNDLIGSACWGKLIEKVEAIPARTETQVVGAAGTFQRARNIRRMLEAGIISDELHQACAAMVADARSTILRLAKLAGVGLPIP